MSSPQPEAGGPAAITPGTPLTDVARAIAARFREAGIASPELDARVLVCHACGISHEHLVANPERPLPEASVQGLDHAVERRIRREPVSRIVGTREFRGLEFALSPRTLDPRPDTETLVEAALALATGEERGGALRILDLGTGSGCVLIALLHALPDAAGVGTDIDTLAIETARRNAETNAVGNRANFICTRWAEGLNGQFDLVVSNPPYIPSRHIDTLEPEVALYDPHRALDGGDDGLQAFREILAGLDTIVAPGGWLLLEVGDGQHRAVQTLLESPAAPVTFDATRRWPDLTGRVRCIGGFRSPSSV